MAGPRASAGGTSFTAPLLIERNTLSSAATTTTIEVSGTATFAGDLNVLGRVSASSTQITGILTLDALVVTGAANFGGTVTVTGAANFGGAVVVTGAANFGGTVTVSGATTFQSSVDVSATATFQGPVKRVMSAAAADGARTHSHYAVYNLSMTSGGIGLVSVDASAGAPQVVGAIPAGSDIISIYADPQQGFEASASAVLRVGCSIAGNSAIQRLGFTKEGVSGNKRYTLHPNSGRSWLAKMDAGPHSISIHGSGNVDILAWTSATGTQPTGGTWACTFTYAAREGSQG